MVSVKLSRAFGLVFLVLSLFGRAEAQAPSPLRTLYAIPSAADAFADEYGQAIIAELAGLMTQRADAACLASRNLSAAALKQTGADNLVRYGSRVRDLLFPDVSDAEVEAAFAKDAGAQGVAELRRFADDQRVQRLLTLAQPVKKDTLVNQVAEAFDRYLLLVKLGLGRAIYPIGSGNLDLVDLADKRSEPFEKAVEAVADEDWFKRFAELHEQLNDAYAQVLERARPADTPSHSMFRGVEADLRAACIRLGDN